MKTHELFELAQLHALALLDEEESRAFEDALERAPAGVREQIRREQSRLGAIRALLPAVEPPAGLRDRVRTAVHAAAEEDRAETRRALALVDDGRTLLPSRRVSPVWRAAALGLAAAAVVFGLTTVFMWNQHRELDRLIRSDALLAAVVKSFGTNYVHDALFDPDTRRVVLVADQEGVDARAAIWTNPSWNQGRLFCLNLPELGGGASYRLVALDEGGRVVATLGAFTSSGALITNEVDLAPGEARRLAIVSADSPDSAPSILLATSASAPNQL